MVILSLYLVCSKCHYLIKKSSHGSINITSDVEEMPLCISRRLSHDNVIITSSLEKTHLIAGDQVLAV